MADRDSSLTDMTLRDVVERMATSDPVPGGGSASALAGAMAAALLGMVVELSERGDPADADDALRDIGAAAAQWQSELLNLAEMDARAYAGVVDARRLPRGTELERQAREVQVAAAVREATRAPLQVMRAAGEVLTLAERLAPMGSAKAISDVGVAALLAVAAVRGAALNVLINLPALSDGDISADATRALEDLLPGIDQRGRAVTATVEGRLA